MQINEINYIMDDFDFDVVNQYMTQTNWSYSKLGQIPDTEQLRATARGLLEKCWDELDTSEYFLVCSGGFLACGYRIYQDENDKQKFIKDIELYFSIESSFSPNNEIYVVEGE